MIIRNFIKLVLVFFSLFPLGAINAQNDVVVEARHSNEVVQETTQDDGNKEDSKEKKKKKKKDEDGDKSHESVQIDMLFLAGLAVNIISVLIIIGYIYLKNYHKTEIIFTYFSFNLVIFALTVVMNNVKFSTGAAFGLFAVFSMLRYRTEGISTKDMTYLFIVIAVGLICSIRIDIGPMALICGLLIVSTYLLDGNVLIKRQNSKPVLYENIQLIKPENYTQLIDDLKLKTGLNIYKVTINKIDFVRDVATLEVFYHD